jgi:hypothetical protein
VEGEGERGGGHVDPITTTESGRGSKLEQNLHILSVAFMTWVDVPSQNFHARRTSCDHTSNDNEATIYGSWNIRTFCVPKTKNVIKPSTMGYKHIKSIRKKENHELNEYKTSITRSSLSHFLMASEWSIESLLQCLISVSLTLYHKTSAASQDDYDLETAEDEDPWD